MSAVFTPGPWKVGIWNGDPQRKHVVDMLGGRKTTFAMLTDRNSMFEPSAIVHSDGDRCEIEANARLIAAAPELYEALSDIMENPLFQTGIGGNPSMVEALISRAAAALRKARGEAL